ncbi:MAG: rod shape-determining protein RodA [bacterium]|nr:rod shape-determining protein RodA [bacterium]
MEKFFRGFDFLIPLFIFIIAVLSLALLWSIAPNLFFQQLIFFVFGFALFLLFSQIDFRIYQNLRWIFYAGSLSFLVLTFILGEITRGSVRWIQIGPLTIQSSEMVKPFLISFFAFFFCRRKINFSTLVKAVILLGLPTFLIFKQPDLGSSLVLMAAFVGIFFYQEFSSAVLLPIAGLLIIAIPASWLMLAQYQKDRIFSFLDPYSDPLGSGYSLIQAMISVGSGQLFGRGLGRGTQSHLAFLPERHTDFIFASFTEEFGFLGAGTILIIYFLILWRVLYVAQNAKQDFAKFFALGIFCMLIFQIFINVGMNLGIAPVTGITLPFLSYGGSSIISTMISLGMVESISRLHKKQETIEIR